MTSIVANSCVYCYNMFSTCHVSSYTGNCAWINTIQQLNGICKITLSQVEKKENTPVAPHHCYPDGPYLSGQQMKVWHYWVSGGSSYLISGPFYHLIPDWCNLSHFMDECQRSWCKSTSSHMCTAQRLAFTILSFTHLSPGSRPQFYEAMHYQWSICFSPGGEKQFSGVVCWSDVLWPKSAAEFSRAIKAV